MDQWPNIIAAASALLGAGIGSVGVLTGERWRTRAAVLQEKRSAALRLRDERKEALLRFFAALRPVERLVHKRIEGEALDSDTAAELESALWLCHLEIHVLCSEPLREAAYPLIEAVTEALWDPPAQRLQLHLGDKRAKLLSAVRAELGIAPWPATEQG